MIELNEDIYIRCFAEHIRFISITNQILCLNCGFQANHASGAYMHTIEDSEGLDSWLSSDWASWQLLQPSPM